MTSSPDQLDPEELRQENTMLREELRTARKASDVKNSLVVDQFKKIDSMLKRLEIEAAKEQELREQLEEELRISEERKQELDKARGVAEHFAQQGLVAVLDLPVPIDLPPVGLITLRGQPMTATTRLLVECLRAVGRSLATR